MSNTENPDEVLVLGHKPKTLLYASAQAWSVTLTHVEGMPHVSSAWLVLENHILQGAQVYQAILESKASKIPFIKFWNRYLILQIKLLLCCHREAGLRSMYSSWQPRK
ncbi:hypothetical protein KIL84_015978 [Mauremys mutica]|uniref:Uncharacterized protein n=1 Tax=Mauremys mutica TaxID=74926 RepID=A0A9D3WRS9_9SAUR|nr:hypothetical protein KIL84_015978 [Mauremys mutica]